MALKKPQEALENFLFMMKLAQKLNRCSTAWGMYLVMQPVLRRTVAWALPMVYGILHEPLKGKAVWVCVAIVHNYYIEKP